MKYFLGDKKSSMSLSSGGKIGSIDTAFYTTVTSGQREGLRKGNSVADVAGKLFNLVKTHNEKNKLNYELEKECNTIPDHHWTEFTRRGSNVKECINMSIAPVAENFVNH